MNTRLQLILFVLVVFALLLAGCGVKTPPTVSSLPSETSVPDAQLKLVRKIDGGENPLSKPNDLAIDSQGNLYVLESGANRIQVFDPTGKFLRMWGKTGSGNGEFNFYNQNHDIELGAIAISANDNVYVADAVNQRIQEFSLDGSYISQWGIKGNADGQFLFPTGIAIDMLGNVIVTDEGKGAIQTFDRNGTFLSNLTQQEFGGGKLGPVTVATDGTIYVADNYAPRILIFKTGKYTGDIKTNAQSWDLTVDNKGNLYVVSDGSMMKYDNSGKPVYRFAGLKVPTAVTVGADGLIYITDIDTHSVYVFQEP